MLRTIWKTDVFLIIDPLTLFSSSLQELFVHYKYIYISVCTHTHRHTPLVRKMHELFDIHRRRHQQMKLLTEKEMEELVGAGSFQCARPMQITSHYVTLHW